MNDNKPHVTIYTDGGCDPNPGTGGWAARLIFPNGQSKELSGGELSSTNNRMELTAAIMALESLEQPYIIDLYTDSEYLKNGITEWIKNWIRKNWRGVKNPDLWQRLHEATEGHEIKWHWVKGHAGNEHNERVDQLAMAEIVKLRRASHTTTESENETIIYAYGSCGELHLGPGAWASIVVIDEKVVELSGSEQWTSNNKLALISAIKALETLQTSSNIEFNTDSRYLFEGMTRYINSWIKNNWHKSDGEPLKNRDLWQRLYLLRQKHQIHWKHGEFFGENKFYKRLFELTKQASRDNS